MVSIEEFEQDRRDLCSFHAPDNKRRMSSETRPPKRSKKQPDWAKTYLRIIDWGEQNLIRNCRMENLKLLRWAVRGGDTTEKHCRSRAALKAPRAPNPAVVRSGAKSFCAARWCQQNGRTWWAAGVGLWWPYDLDLTVFVPSSRLGGSSDRCRWPDGGDLSLWLKEWQQKRGWAVSDVAAKPLLKEKYKGQAKLLY